MMLDVLKVVPGQLKEHLASFEFTQEAVPLCVNKLTYLVGFGNLRIKQTYRSCRIVDDLL
jgi:hypothetical protein